jgi:hypothetical protein
MPAPSSTPTGPGTISPTEALEGSLAAIADLEAQRRVLRRRGAGSGHGGRGRRAACPSAACRSGSRSSTRSRAGRRPRRRWCSRTEIADYDGTMTARLKQAGAVLVGQTTASEFGGINCTYTRLHGATSNPYDLERTPGGSSGGSAASVSGGLLPICTGGRRRRVDPDPGRLHRAVRPEGDLRSHPQGSAHRDRAADGGDRVPVPLGA